MIGKILGGRYEILEEIGKGGMAYVYKARCVLLNRIVALKILRDDLGGDEEFLKRFNAEAQAAASLDHPNIVSIFDVGVDNDRHYITMEYVDGQTLKEYITRKGPLPYKEAFDIAAQICDAIEAAHNKNIVHRDIKPHNILIKDDGKIKVADFGIARFGNGNTLSSGHDILGSVHYISPEQAKGISVDNRSDIYSLGVVLYEMLSGKLPFESDNAVSVAMKQIEESPVDIVSIVPDLPISCQHIAFKAMSKDPDLRYQTAVEFKEDIIRIYNNPEIIIDKRFLYKNLNTEPETQTEQETIVNEAKPIVKVSMIFLSVLTSAVIVLAGYLIVKINPVKMVSGIISNDPKKVQVPSLVGKSYDEAKKICDKLGLTLVIKDKIEDNSKDENTIISQSPIRNKTIEEGGIIDVDVSVKTKEIILKDYVGGEYSAAQKELENMNLHVSIIFEKSDKEINTILEQNPNSGASIKSGDRVTLYVSLGRDDTDDLIKVPGVVGKTYSEAKSILESKGLKVGSVSGVLNPSSDDKVTAQGIHEGAMVKEGSEITLTLEHKETKPDTPTDDDDNTSDTDNSQPTENDNDSNFPDSDNTQSGENNNRDEDKNDSSKPNTESDSEDSDNNPEAESE